MANLDAANARSDEIKVAASRRSEMRVSFMLIVSMLFGSRVPLRVALHFLEEVSMLNGLTIGSIGSLVKCFTHFGGDVIWHSGSGVSPGCLNLYLARLGIFLQVDQIFDDVFDVEFGIKLKGDHFCIVRSKG